MRRIVITFVSLVTLLVFAQPARAQSAVDVTEVGTAYTFGEEITFTARFQAPVAIREAYLSFQAEGDQNTHVFPLSLDADGRSEYRYSVADGRMRPFVHVDFWYHLLLADGETFDSPHYSFNYDDNRFPWQKLEDGQVRVFWYAGDMLFGQAAFDAAHAGLQAVQVLVPVPSSEPIDIYIYSSAADVQNVLNLGGYAWVAGHASADLGVVLVSIAPGENQSMEMTRQIPHELAHVLLYRLVGTSYASLPSWLVEGIASQVEQYPNADYVQVLSLASQNEALLPISDLCGLFPADASGAILAYAESGSFTHFLHSTYGTSGLQTLVRAYADGLSCDQGARRAFGLPLSQLDLRWRRATFGENLSSAALQNLLPYLAILLIILIIPTWRLWTKPQKKEEHATDKPK